MTFWQPQFDSWSLEVEIGNIWLHIYKGVEIFSLQGTTLHAWRRREGEWCRQRVLSRLLSSAISWSRGASPLTGMCKACLPPYLDQGQHIIHDIPIWRGLKYLLSLEECHNVTLNQAISSDNLSLGMKDNIYSQLTITTLLVRKTSPNLIKWHWGHWHYVVIFSSMQSLAVQQCFNPGDIFQNNGDNVALSCGMLGSSATRRETHFTPLMRR